MTPLLSASKFGHTRAVEILIELGANIEAFQEFCDGETPFLKAVKGGHLQTVKYLLSKGCRTSVSSLDGAGALHWAARRGYEDIIECLKDICLIERTDNDGKTPLIAACENGKLPCA